MTKIKTFAFNARDSDLIDTNIENIIETLKIYMEEAGPEEEDDKEVVFEIKVQKKYTQEEVDNLPEWDG